MILNVDISFYEKYDKQLKWEIVASFRQFSLKYMQYSSVKLALSGEKYLAAEHASIFQARPKTSILRRKPSLKWGGFSQMDIAGILIHSARLHWHTWPGFV